jgi:type II secretory pathway component PulF
VPGPPFDSASDAARRVSEVRNRALASAGLALGLAELLRSGTRAPEALAAIAARHRQQNDPWATVLERVAVGVRDEGRSLFEAVHAERPAFTPRFVAALALANLGGKLFRVFVGRLRDYVRRLPELPPAALPDFPWMRNEIREFCFYFGHLTVERASQTEVQHWLPRIFTARLRLPVTHLLGRFFDQGILLSQAFAKTPPFHDPEMVLAIQAGEERNQVGRELLALADWLQEREALEERLRLNEWILPDRPDTPAA